MITLMVERYVKDEGCTVKIHILTEFFLPKLKPDKTLKLVPVPKAKKQCIGAFQEKRNVSVPVPSEQLVWTKKFTDKIFLVVTATT
jgi:hypothetical protein